MSFVGAHKECVVCGEVFKEASAQIAMERATGRCMGCLTTTVPGSISVPTPFYSFAHSSILPDDQDG